MCISDHENVSYFTIMAEKHRKHSLKTVKCRYEYNFFQPTARHSGIKETVTKSVDQQDWRQTMT